MTTETKINIYLTHASSYDYINLLYLPLRSPQITALANIFLPHEKSNTPINSKNLIEQADLVMAVVSYPSTGQGIELGWANMMNIPIVCFYQEGKNFSSSLSLLTSKFLVYHNNLELVDIVGDFLTGFCKR